MTLHMWLCVHVRHCRSVMPTKPLLAGQWNEQHVRGAPTITVAGTCYVTTVPEKVLHHWRHTRCAFVLSIRSSGLGGHSLW